LSPAFWFLFPAAAILVVLYAGPLLFAFHARVGDAVDALPRLIQGRRANWSAA
jgi:hypothetical protein